MPANVVALTDRNAKTEVAVDSSLIRTCVVGFFHDARANEGFIGSRHFPQHPKKLPPDDPRRYSDPDWIEFDPADIDAAVRRLTTHAQDAARGIDLSARVFSPPLVLFRKPADGSKLRATEEAVAYCSALSVDLDENPDASLARLREVLGNPWMVVESGGVTPNGERKKHVHWRLAHSARSLDELFMLRQLRRRAVDLVGADGSGAALCHPYRWPGSVHTKNAPRLCRIIESNPDVVIVPHEVSDRLLAACLEDGKDPTTLRGRKREGKGNRPFKTKRAWPREALIAFAEGLPNNEGLVPWDAYRHVQMTLWDASHNSDDGLEALMLWSAKAGKHDPAEVEDSWKHVELYPPEDLSAGTLMWLLKKLSPHVIPTVQQWLIEDVVSDPEPVSPVDGGGIFDGLEEVTTLGKPSKDVPYYVAEMNERHAIIMHRGKAFPISEEDDGSTYKTGKEDLILRYADREVRLLEGKQVLSRYDAWIRSPDRRVYPKGWDFDPNGTPPGVYNRWRGFPPLDGDDHVDASGRECALILAHMRNIVCSGDEEHFAYLIRWFAHLIQRPGEKPGVAVVLKGLEGTGKDTVGYYIEAMMPKLYVNTAQDKHITGAFNSHLTNRLFLHVEELGWIGKAKDKEGVLKSLITNPNHTEEGKGVDVDTGQKSFLRLWITSNEVKPVNASAEARRFFVLNVSDAHRKDEAYFGAIERERCGVGPAALRKYLAAVDLAGFNVRNCPATDALAEVQVESLEGFDRFWFELLATGGQYAGENGVSWEDGPVLIERARLYRDYERWSKERREPPITDVRVGKRLVTLAKTEAKALASQHRTGDGGRAWCYRLPSLPDLRKAFGL